jgi:transposase
MHSAVIWASLASSPVGRHRVVDLIGALHAASEAAVPTLAREALQSLIAELRALEVRIEAVEEVIMREHKSNAVSRRLATIPGIGSITASAIADGRRSFDLQVGA